MMELNYFKDRLFDLLNDSEGLNISDINADDPKNLLTISTTDGSVFQIECRQILTKFL